MKFLKAQEIQQIYNVTTPLPYIIKTENCVTIGRLFNAICKRTKFVLLMNFIIAQFDIDYIFCLF